MELLIRGGRLLDGTYADIAVQDGRIVDHVTDPEVIDATGLVVAPGFVDGHQHVWQAPLRGLGPDMTLPQYFTAILGRVAGMTPAQARHATLLGAAEALNAGITTVLDFSNPTITPAHTDAVVDAYATAGIRAVVGHANPADQRDVERLAGLRGSVTGAVAVYGSFEEVLHQIGLARRLGVLATMHAGGNDDQIQRLYEAGALGPHLHLVHLNGLTDSEAKLLVDTGTGVTVTPLVEATMGHGLSAWSTFAAAGGRAGLGTDVAVNAPSDLFEPLRDTLRFHRMTTGTMHPAADLLGTVTIDSARAIGLGDEIGALDVGKRADLVLLGGLAHLPGDADVTGAVVTSLGVSDVHTVVANGQVVKHESRLTGLDLDALRSESKFTHRTG